MGQRCDRQARVKQHPCPFPKAVLDIFDRLLPASGSVLDPYAGTGKLHELATPTRTTVGVELEPEWARWHADTIIGDSADLDFVDGLFDAVATSPDFGNRMADPYAGERCKTCDGRGTVTDDAVNWHSCDDCAGTGRQLRSRRHTYRLSLGRPMSEGSTVSQWGPKYRDLHRPHIVEFMRVLKPGGMVLLDIKNHRRAWEEQLVAEWWRAEIVRQGGLYIAEHPVDTDGLQHSGPDTNDLPEVVLEFRKA